ncbi:MAG: hypothetical protein ACFFHD_10300 [Promethearchaeota archaeon]
MISGFTIILEDKILYCSDENKYNAFEIVLFVEKFLHSINPKNTWRLKKISLKDEKIGREKILIEHIITDLNQNLFFCILGNFDTASKEAFKMLDEFSKQVNIQFKNFTELKYASGESTFEEIISLITNYLEDKYTEPLEEEIIYTNKDNNIINKILYAGISSQGLPIISQLYDINLLKNLEQERTYENVELFSSDLSAKLATISMNTQIRAKTKIKEIHLYDIEEEESKKIILFGNIHRYSLDFIASGDFYNIKNVFKRLKDKMTMDPVFHQEFTGDLRPFKHLKQLLSGIINEFDY